LTKVQDEKPIQISEINLGKPDQSSKLMNMFSKNIQLVVKTLQISSPKLKDSVQKKGIHSIERKLEDDLRNRSNFNASNDLNKIKADFESAVEE
jgi:hypothetical protein